MGIKKDLTEYYINNDLQGLIDLLNKGYSGEDLYKAGVFPICMKDFITKVDYDRGLIYIEDDELKIIEVIYEVLNSNKEYLKYIGEELVSMLDRYNNVEFIDKYGGSSNRLRVSVFGYTNRDEYYIFDDGWEYDDSLEDIYRLNWGSKFKGSEYIDEYL